MLPKSRSYGRSPGTKACQASTFKASVHVVYLKIPVVTESHMAKVNINVTRMYIPPTVRKDKK